MKYKQKLQQKQKLETRSTAKENQDYGISLSTQKIESQYSE